MGVLKNVHWEAYQNCNMNCKFCFATFTENSLNTYQAKKLINKIAEHGSKRFCLTGGDPFQRPDLTEIINYAKNQGLNTAIDTNGKLATKQKISELENILDRISLPLDGSTEQIQQKVRPDKNHYNRTLELIKYIQQKNIKLKINTIVTKQNFEDILNVGEILKQHQISQWAIFQFTPINRGRKNKETFDLEPEYFAKIEEKVKSQYYPFPVKTSWKKTDHEAFFMISPQGMAYTVINGKNHYLGSLLEQDLNTLLEVHPKIYAMEVA